MTLPLSEFKHESFQDRDAVALYLESVAQGIRKGTVTFHYGDNEIDLSPAERVDLQVEAKRGDTKSKIKFKLSWTDTGAAEGEELVVE